MDAQDAGRHVLPLPHPQHVGAARYDAQSPDTCHAPPTPAPQPVGATSYAAKTPNPSFPPTTPTRPPACAPNVLVIMLDDAGFGSSSTFGGPVNTPTFDRLAAGGLRYTRFHTTAL